MGKTEEILSEAISRIPLVDAHAHNIVCLDSDFPFVRCFTEAEGDALKDVPHSLSFKRSIRDIAELYGCNAKLEDVEKCRSCLGLERVCSLCFAASNISAVLIDDGLRISKMHDIGWHTDFVPYVGRILRIETVAEDVLNEGILGGNTWTLESFTKCFVSKLKSLAKVVVSFKSIVAYRSGLDINPSVTTEQAEEGLLKNLEGGVPVRVTHKSFIDYIFTHSLVLATSLDLPMQIHTGFGDRDLDLRLANPLHLRPILEDSRFKGSRIALLHASYPYSKEASYLASIYPQVYLDFGLAIPKLSVHGMLSAVKELLELCPLNKVMFSTDGYAFPETFYLGAKWAHKVLSAALSDACNAQDLSVHEAIEVAQKILRDTALLFYKLDGTAILGSTNEDNAVSNHSQISSQMPEKLSLVRLLWIDCSGQHRCRVVPQKRFFQVVKKHGVGLAQCCIAMSSTIDGPVQGSGLTAVGEIRLIPDMKTLHALPWCKEKMVLVDMHIKPGYPWEYCPRTTLKKISQRLFEEFGLVMNAGFEAEFYILRPTKCDEGKWTHFDSTPYCSSQSFDGASSFLSEIVNALQKLDIYVEQLHAEGGGGQFEMAIAHATCLNAADNLVFLKETVKAIARQNGFLATFLPKLNLLDIGSGCHVHLSLWKDGENKFMACPGSAGRYGMSIIGEEFMAGVLHHLPSLMAFTAPLPNSYERLQPNTWSGAYQVWGHDNKEAPIRTASTPGVQDTNVTNFEVKTFDGCANPYFGLAAIIAAGIDGLQKHLVLPDPVDKNPSELDGVVKRLPKSLEESITALEQNEFLKSFIGENLVNAVVAVRKAEVQAYATNKDIIQRLIHRY
eukprot:TRINITY_DN2511_c0_g1_i1.p1 TRINITY_DN2511_c0_g1~~TRINITY_DN2511_c0_g1_i1.p1  ORF type:complete len:844 (+),score=165.73 TRINITY_DN2511_c0_g1_i1:452-2983(+)